MAFLVSAFIGIVPMLIYAFFVYWLDRYEKEPVSLLAGVFIWGAVISSGFAFLINTILSLGIYLATNSETATKLTTGSLVAPFVEETLKGFAVLLVFLIFKNEFDSVLDGIIYSAITALGFAATENIYYIYYYGYIENGWGGLFGLALIRTILVGWQHPFYTAFFGIGLAIARLNRSYLLKMGAPVVGLVLGMLIHALHNAIGSMMGGMVGLATGTIFDWTGWLFMFLFVIGMVLRERLYLVRYLRDEVLLENLSEQQYQRACSARSQFVSRINALFMGRYQITDRFFQVCGELAHKKHQLDRIGEEENNSDIIQGLRTEMHQLSSRLGIV